MNSKITEYQKSCWKNYKSTIGLDDNYKYLYGNPVKVHVPIDTANGSLMIVGAYPTAHFQNIESNGKIICDIPFEDHLYPFSTEKYFDGSDIRTVESGKELESLFLNPLGIERKECWITDLVKVFLFKKGHIEKYEQLGCNSLKSNRNKFSDFAKLSLDFLNDEIVIANPLAILLLGVEVTSIVLECSKLKADSYLLNPELHKKEICGRIYGFIPSPHPGILMRENNETGKWKSVLKEKTIPLIKEILNK